MQDNIGLEIKSLEKEKKGIVPIVEKNVEPRLRWVR